MTTTDVHIEGRPAADEAGAYYFGYIDQVEGDDVLAVLEAQLAPTLALLRSISEERSLHRYAADKWSYRQALAHLSDTERLFCFRALWFARGFDSPLPSFDQHVAVTAGCADDVPWAHLIEEFHGVRLATLGFFRNLPKDAWQRNGIASDNRFTVRALAFIAAGHVTHHTRILQERYT
jgi:DinB superfamily